MDAQPSPPPGADATPTPALRPCRHLPVAALQRQSAQWQQLGWMPERELLIGWRLRRDAVQAEPGDAPPPLPPALKIPGARHLLWRTVPDALQGAALPGWLAAGAWVDPEPGPEAGPDSDPDSARGRASPSEAGLALLDLLITDDDAAAALADQLGLPLWWLGESPPAACAGIERQFRPDPEPAPFPASHPLDAWAARLGPVLTMHVMAHGAAARLSVLGDEQAAVLSAFDAFQRGDGAAARQTARRLLVIHPHRADLWRLLGVLAQQDGDLASAAAHFEHVTTLTPGYADGWRSLALARLAQGRLEAALDAAQRGVSASPGDAAARALHARLLQRLGLHELAATEAANALLLAPQDLGALMERANALASLGQTDPAIQLYRRGLQQHPAALDLHFNLAMVLARSGRSDEAIPHIDQLLANTDAAHPLHTRAVHELVKAHAACGAWAPAASEARRALALAPTDLGALRRLVALERQLGHPERAHAVLQPHAAAATLPADLATTWRLLCHELADWQAGAALVTPSSPDSPLPAPDVLHWLAADPGQRDEARRLLSLGWQRITRATDAAGTAEPGRSARRPRRRPARLRIAYAHAERPDGRDARWIQALLGEHDPARFDTWACSWGRADGIALRSDEQADEHSLRRIDLTAHTDLQAARHLRELHIDLLLDLEGCGSLQRAGVLAHHPATLQLSWLERLGSTLPPWIDTALADRSAADGDARILRIPHAHLLPRPPTPADTSSTAPSRHAAALPERVPVLACAAAHRWIRPEVFQCWMRLLKACPPAVLWLQGGPAIAQRHLRAAAQAAGITPQRLVFAPAEQLQADGSWLGLADLHLAPGPAGDPHSLGDALLANVPPVAFDGSAPGLPAPASLLTAAGLDPAAHLCRDLAGYEERVMGLLRRPRELMALRRQITQATRQAALFDLRRHVHQLEALFDELHERHAVTHDAAPARQTTPSQA